MAEEPQAPQIETPETPETKEPTEVTFTQSDLDREADRRVAKALEKQKADMQAKIEAAKSEGEKLAKMSADEKAAEEAKQRMEALKAREDAIKAKELSFATKDLLAKNGLPDTLADSLTVLGDADAISKAVATLKETLDQEIKNGIQTAAQSSAPAAGDTPLESADDPFSRIMKQYQK